MWFRSLAANHSHLLAVASDIGLRHDKALLECHLGDGALIFAVGGWLVVKAVQHASLLAQRRTDTTCELGEGVGGVQQLVGQLKVAFVQGVVPLGC